MEELTPFLNSDIYKFYGSKNNSGVTLTHPVEIIVIITKTICAILPIISPYGSFTKPIYNINRFVLQECGRFVDGVWLCEELVGVTHSNQIWNTLISLDTQAHQKQ